MAPFFRDLRYAVRLLLKAPAFALVAVFTLALGIGANTAIFSVTDALLLRQLPYSDPQRLILIYAEKPGSTPRQGPLSYLRYTALLHSSRAFSSLAAFTPEVFNLTGVGDPEQIVSARVAWNFFDTLGVRPVRGRTFLPAEDQPGGAAVVLLSHALWTRRFAAAPSAVGRSITLDGRDFTIIGVLSADFRFSFLAQADLWVPRVFELNLATPSQIYGGASFLNLVARLAPGVSPRAAQAEMDTLAVQYRRDQPKAPDADPELVVRAGNLRDQMAAGIRPALWILSAAVALVLLIACANVAGLLLSRALGRRREMAVRTALGAPRAALLRQLLVESLLLALCGGAAGTLLGMWGVGLLLSLAGSQLPGIQPIAVDARVLAFTLAVSLASGLLFGLAPAFEISRTDLNSALRVETRAATGARRQNLTRNLLVIAQVAFSMVLLVGAGLLVRSFAALRAANPGFDPRALLTMNLALPPARYSTAPRMTAFYDRLLQEVSTLPGVQSAAIASALPINPVRFSPVLLDDQPRVPLAERPILAIAMTDAAYRRTMRIPLLAGRDFNPHDDAAAPRVALVNQALARAYWPNANAVGKRVLLGRMTQPTEIVGVIGDVRNINLAADPQPEITLPYAQLPWASMNLIVRTAGDPLAFTAAVRARVLAVDPDQPVTAVQSMQELLDAGAGETRLTMSLLGAFSLCATLLGAVGIYGAIAYAVAERTVELGIRMALGAGRREILRLVLSQALALTGAGVLIGLAISLAATRLLAGLLYRVQAHDPAILALSALLFVAVAMAAAYLPARRALRVDPVTALRQ